MIKLGASRNNQVLQQHHNEGQVLQRFRALRTEKFDRMEDPWKVEQWLREMDLIFDTIECLDYEKCRMLTF